MADAGDGPPRRLNISVSRFIDTRALKGGEESASVTAKDAE